MAEEQIPNAAPEPPVVEMEPAPAPEVTKEERTMGMLCHILALAGFVFPFGNIIAPLILWMVKKNESAYIDYHGKEVLNFQISLTIYFFVAFLLVFVIIGFLLLPALAVFAIVMTIMAAIKANEGVMYRFPLTIRILK